MFAKTMRKVFDYPKRSTVRSRNQSVRDWVSTFAWFSTFQQAPFCGNAGIAIIVEILAGFQQLFEKLCEFFTIPWKTLRVYHISTKPFIFINKYISLLICISVYRRNGKYPYRSTGKST